MKNLYQFLLVIGVIFLVNTNSVLLSQSTQNQCEDVSRPGSGGGGVNPHYWDWESDNVHYITTIGKLQSITTMFGSDNDVCINIATDIYPSTDPLHTEINILGDNGSLGDNFLMPFFNGAFYPNMKVWASGYYVSDVHGAWFNPWHQTASHPEIHPLNQLIGQVGGDAPGDANDFSVLFALDASDRFDPCLTSGRSFTQEFNLHPFPELLQIRGNTGRTKRLIGTITEESHLDLLSCAKRSSAFLGQSPLSARFWISANLNSPERDGVYFPFYIGKFHRGTCNNVFSDQIAMDVGTYEEFGLPPSPTTTAEWKVLRITWTFQIEQNVEPKMIYSNWYFERSVPEQRTPIPELSDWEFKHVEGESQTVTFVRYYAPGNGAVSVISPGGYEDLQYGSYAKNSWKLIMGGASNPVIYQDVNAMIQIVGSDGEICPNTLFPFPHIEAIKPTVRSLLSKEISYAIQPSKITLSLNPSSENLAQGQIKVGANKMCSYSSWTSATVNVNMDFAPLAEMVGDLKWFIRIARDTEGQTYFEQNDNTNTWINLNAQPDKSYNFGGLQVSIDNGTSDAILLNVKANDDGELPSFFNVLAIRAIGQTSFGERVTTSLRVVPALTFSCGDGTGNISIEQRLGLAVQAAQAIQRNGGWKPGEPFPERLDRKISLVKHPLPEDIDMLILEIKPGPIRETVEDFFLFQNRANLSQDRMRRLEVFLNLPNLVKFK